MHDLDALLVILVLLYLSLLPLTILPDLMNVNVSVRVYVCLYKRS